MIQKCPKCGQWCETEKDSIIDRYSRGANDAAEIGEGFLGGIGSLFGKSGERIGRTLGYGTGATLGGTISGIGQVLFGDSYNFCCPKCGYEWSSESELEDQSDECHHIMEIESLISKLGDNDPSDTVAIREYIRNITEYLQSEIDDVIISRLLDVRSVAYWQLTEYDKAYYDIVKSLDIMDDSHSRALRGLYQLEINQVSPNPSAKSIVKAITDLTAIYEEEHQDRHISLEYLMSVLEIGIKDYINQFISLSPSERRFICFTDKIHAMGNQILVLPLGQVPQGITFQEGLPRKNVIYEVHPFKPNHYVNLDNFEFDMFNDKIEEFQWIMENLGARKISINVESNRTQNTNQKDHRDVGAEVNYGSLGINGNYKREEISNKFEELHLSLEQHSEFLPGSEPPHLPADLVWYPHLSDWQKKVNSRMAGRVNSFEIRFESKTSQSLSESEAKQLEAEMKYLMTTAKGNIDNTRDYHISRSDNHIWRIQVDFFPLNSFANDNNKKSGVPINQNQTLLTEGEQDYLNTFRDFIRDGKISDRERKLLDKISNQAGISAARVTELESMAIPTQKKKWWKNLVLNLLSE